MEGIVMIHPERKELLAELSTTVREIGDAIEEADSAADLATLLNALDYCARALNTHRMMVIIDNQPCSHLYRAATR